MTSYYCTIHRLHEAIDLIKDKIREHFDEATQEHKHDKLDIDWHYYLAASHQNCCFVVTLHKKDVADVIGYSVFLVAKDPTHLSILEANNVGVFVKKPHRGKGTLLLVKKSHEFLKALGVVSMNYLVKDDALARLLKHVGCAPEYTLWSIRP